MRADMGRVLGPQPSYISGRSSTALGIIAEEDLYLRADGPRLQSLRTARATIPSLTRDDQYKRRRKPGRKRALQGQRRSENWVGAAQAPNEGLRAATPIVRQGSTERDEGTRGRRPPSCWAPPTPRKKHITRSSGMLSLASHRLG